MSKFEVFESRSGNGFLLNVQSDLLDGLNTRVVVPLLPRSEAPPPAQYLNPIFEIEGSDMVMVTQYMAAVPIGELSNSVDHLEKYQHEISAALDMLFLGF